MVSVEVRNATFEEFVKQHLKKSLTTLCSSVPTSAAEHRGSVRAEVGSRVQLRQLPVCLHADPPPGDEAGH